MSQPVDREQVIARCAAGDRWHSISRATGYHWRTVRRIAQDAGYGSHAVGGYRRPASSEEQLIGLLIEAVGIQPTAKRLDRPTSSIAYLAKRLGVSSPLKRGQPRKDRP